MDGFTNIAGKDSLKEGILFFQNKAAFSYAYTQFLLFRFSLPLWAILKRIASK